MAIALMIIAVQASAGPREDYQSVMLTLSRNSSLSTDVKTDRLSEAYALHFEGLVRREGMSPDDLQALFDASNMLASYTMYFRSGENSNYVANMVYAREVLASLGVHSERNDQDLYGALIAARRFDEARGLARASVVLGRQAPLEFDIARDFSPVRSGYFDLPSGGRKFILRNSAAAGSGVRVIVVSGCHAARDAARGIASDAALREAFLHADALWLAPADRAFDSAEIRQWNLEFPDSPIRIAFNHAAWKGVDFSRQPAFFFFKDGRLVSKSVGWSRSGPPQALLKALRDTGLIR
ncbi:hypothetical protein K4L06_13705 [Lysobacter sp. BMK333-48F3]|uniref:hypothetical protein n=1 Tax=Lysobacter sp. BMK333-48F3 TaxID=2867962 RepID=UPI001C8B8B59|nr:hypothetical protein [Lysobacter sp. BMK333-48F3]MBX9402365.1 hypothetical protein [Lysobacter sp. BMK333-48F3]